MWFFLEILPPLRIASRGTVRLALKQAGLEARSVSADQMKIVVEKLLPTELAARGVDGVEGICQSIADGVSSVSDGADPETPDAVFKRLGGS